MMKSGYLIPVIAKTFKGFSPNFLCSFIFSLLLLPHYDLLAQDSMVVKVYFDSDQWIPGKRGIQLLDSAVSKFSGVKFREIHIRTYCDSTNKTAYNLKLARKRALGIEELLKKKGVSQNLISLLPVGEVPGSGKNDSEWKRALNRRGEVIFYLEKKRVIAHEVKSPEILAFDTLEVGQTVNFKGLQFVPGSPVLLDTALPLVKELADMLKAYPGMEIELNGHVCCDNEYFLSLARAETVKKKLIMQGIDAKRLFTKGWGNTRPLNRERSDEERQANRRVEIRILKK